MTDDFRFGIEEEYFLVDSETGESPTDDAANRFHSAADRRVKPASHELLKGQVEVQTEPGTDFDAASAALRGLRRELAAIAKDHGLALIAAGSHPLAESRDQATTDKPRYQALQEEFGIIARRSMVCATHIHVEVKAADRIAIMNRLIPFLPLLYALSVSSPFWQGHEAKIKGFRLTAFSEWPRMGVPDIFADQAAYEQFVHRLVDAEVMKDASFVWWHIRPSTHYPTIELRVCDGCSNVDDAVAIAALYQALVRAVSRLPEINAGVGPIDRAVCAENIWQVQRLGIHANLVDARGSGTRTIQQALEEALALVHDDVEALGSGVWVEKTRAIADRGTSADRQLKTFRDALAAGKPHQAALRAVIDMLATETIA